MLPFFSWGQNISIDPRNFNSGNIELTRAVNENRNIKGHPYLEEDFSISTIEFKDGTTYEGLIRFNIVLRGDAHIDPKGIGEPIPTVPGTFCAKVSNTVVVITQIC